MTTYVSTFTLRQLQDELKPWTAHNFGVQEPWKPLLGVVEELGELQVATQRLDALKELKPETIGVLGLQPKELEADVEDAVADTVIFLADFCNTMGFDLTAILQRKVTFLDDELVVVGRLAHAFLKSTQGIRGSEKDHREAMEASVASLYGGLNRFAEEHLHYQLLVLVEKVWNRVKQRDFKKDPKAGGEATG